MADAKEKSVEELLNIIFPLPTEHDQFYYSHKDAGAEIKAKLLSLYGSLEEEIIKSKARLEVAKFYTGLEGYPCPLCEYKNGEFIKPCSFHHQIAELSTQMENMKCIIKQMYECKYEPDKLMCIYQAWQGRIEK